MPQITTRPVVHTDELFLLGLYESSRPELTSMIGLDDETKNVLIRQQFLYEQHFLNTNYPDADLQIILLNGKPAGRLYIHRGEEAYRIITIALLPSYRNRGIGRKLLTTLLQEASDHRKKVCLQVVWYNNQACLLYKSLGFDVIEDKGVYCEMHWIPPIPSS